MPKDYASRARQSNSTQRRRSTPARSVAVRHKPKQTRSQARRRVNTRQEEARSNLIWKPVLMLVVMIVLVVGGWHFLREHTKSASSGVPVISAQPVKLPKKASASDDALPNGPLKPVTFQFQPLQQAKVKAQSGYVLQLGTYAEDDDKLQNLTSNLDGSGIQYHLDPFDRAGQPLVRVEVGPFKLLSQAQQMQNQLLQQQIYTVIKEIQ